MSADFLEIPGYRPEWISDPEEFCFRHQPTMRQALGLDVAEAFVLWNLHRGCHFRDAPVVLVLNDGFQIEVCCWKLDEMSVTYNTIVLDQTVEWAWPDEGPWYFEWRSGALPELVTARGRRIDSVALVEIEFTAARSAWCLGGREFGLSGERLTVFNGLDDTQVSNTFVSGVGWRRRDWLPESD